MARPKIQRLSKGGRQIREKGGRWRVSASISPAIRYALNEFCDDFGGSESAAIAELLGRALRVPKRGR